MKVRIKANIGTKMVSELGLAAAYQEGQIVDLPKADYEALMDSKNGGPLCEPPPQPEGVHAVASPDRSPDRSTEPTKPRKGAE